MRTTHSKVDIYTLNTVLYSFHPRFTPDLVSAYLLHRDVRQNARTSCGAGCKVPTNVAHLETRHSHVGGRITLISSPFCLCFTPNSAGASLSHRGVRPDARTNSGAFCKAPTSVVHVAKSTLTLKALQSAILYSFLSRFPPDLVDAYPSCVLL